MSISKNLKKIMVASAALVMALSAGAGIDNSQANARRRYHYHYTRRYHAKRHYRTRRRARKPVRRASSRRSMYSYFSKGEIKHLAKTNQEPVSLFKSDMKANNQGHVYGPAKAYDMHGFMMILTKPGLRSYAKSCKISVKSVLKNQVEHATKYWTWDGTPTKLNDREAEKDVFKLLNREREAKGYNPISVDPDLQAIAEGRAKMMNDEEESYEDSGSEHTAKDGTPYTDITSHKYHIPFMDNSNENAGAGEEYTGYKKPWTLAKYENDSWDAGHRANRDNPANAYGGIGIDNSCYVEEFASQPTPDNATPD